MKILKKTAWLGVLALALAACVAGCESDSVTPHDVLPAVTAEGSALTSTAIAKAMVEVGPRILDPGKVVVTDSLLTVADINGVIHIDFRDGPDGASAEPAAATWAHCYTGAGEPVVVTLGAYGGTAEFEFDVMAGISRSPDTVELLEGSGGTMVSGDRTTTFTASGLVIDGGDYPASGEVTVVPADGPTASVTFDGTHVARAMVNSVLYWVDLDEGVIIEQ